MLPAGDAGEGVEYIHEEDGSITARDIETGVASFGETKAEALAMLAEALGLYRGEIGHEPTDEELRELGVDPETARTQGELPPVLDDSDE
jgi:predicted RNase H-like HicB family nuclease